MLRNPREVGRAVRDNPVKVAAGIVMGVPATLFVVIRFLGAPGGTVGEWLSGFGAFVAAGTALWIAGHEARRGHEAAKQAALDAVRAEAAHMTAWVKPSGDLPDEVTGMSENPVQQFAKWRLTVVNKTDSAIYEWSVGVWYMVRSKAVMHCVDIQSHKVGALAPGDAMHKQFRLESPLPTAVGELRVCIVWRDNLGRWWLNYNGSLVGPAAEKFREPWKGHGPDDVDVDARSERIIGQPIPGWPAPLATPSHRSELV